MYSHVIGAVKCQPKCYIILTCNTLTLTRQSSILVFVYNKCMQLVLAMYKANQYRYYPGHGHACQSTKQITKYINARTGCLNNEYKYV